MASKFFAIDGEMVARIKPRNDQVLIERLRQTKSKGGILLPASRPNDLPSEHGKVIAAGSRIIHQSGTQLEMDLKPGDEVMFHAFPSGVEIKEGDKEYLLIAEKQVVCKLESASKAK